MSKIKLAAQMYTVREFTQNLNDFQKTIKKISKIGYKYAQVSGIGDIPPEKIRETCDKYSIEICATHVPYEMLKDTKKAVEYHDILGCKYAGLGAMPENYRNDKDGILSFVKNANKISDNLKENGLQFIYHNHNFEFQKFEQKTFLDIMFEKSSKSFDFEIDTYWIQAGGANPVKWIKKCKDRMDVVHFKDMRPKGFESRFCEVGYGNLDWPEIIKSCLEIDVKYAAVEQDDFFEDPKDPFKSLEMSYNYLMDNFGEVFI